MKQIKLLHLMRTFNAGGVERSTITYSNLLSGKINFVGIFAGKGIFNHSNIVDQKVGLFYSSGNISNPFAFFINFLRIFRIIHSNKINVINYHQRVFIPYIYLIKIFYPKILILYSHHSVFNDYLNRFLVADTYFVFSNASRNDLMKYSKSPVISVKHGIEIPNNRKREIKQIERIGYVGRFEKLKGIFLLLEAFKIISNENNNLQLVLIGEGKEKYLIKDYILRNRLINKVTLKDPIIDLQILYDGIDCLVLPSVKHEGFGLVLAEAMARNIPVIASDLEAFHEIIQDGITGLFFKNGNAESLTRQLNLLMSDNQLRNRLTVNGFQYVTSNHILDNYLAYFYEQLNKFN